MNEAIYLKKHHRSRSLGIETYVTKIDGSNYVVKLYDHNQYKYRHDKAFIEQLNHHNFPHILQYFQYKQISNNQAYHVSEYIEHGDFETFIHNPRRSSNELMSLLIQMALGLTQSGYTYGIYHGQLHPGNLLVKQTSLPLIKYQIGSYHIATKVYGYIPIFSDFGKWKMCLTESFYLKRVQLDVKKIFDICSFDYDEAFDVDRLDKWIHILLKIFSNYIDE